MRPIALIFPLLFLFHTLLAVDPDIFDGSRYPVPVVENDSDLAAAMQRVLNAQADQEGFAGEGDRASTGALPENEEGTTDADPQSAEGQNQGGPSSEATPSPGGERQAPPEFLRIEQGQVVIGDPNLRIDRDDSALGATLGKPVQRDDVRSGGVGGSGPDRSRTPRGAASGRDLPTDL